ncbi:MAG: hypothetical protein JWQ49_1716, partial [Edaphobacter sp.]|nr:hypothetical protein [Edaphobacter sp.]
MSETRAGEVQVVLTLEQLSYSAAVAKARKAIRDLGDEADKTSRHTVTSMAAASGALRSLEGSIPIRAAERFIGMLPGVGTAVLAAFPVVGAIALTNVIIRGATELANFVKKAQEAKEQFRLAFQEMTNTGRLQNDELAKTNIQMENQIAKLEHKPQNELAAALIEDRIEADKLALSIDAAAAKIKAMLEQNKAGFLQQLFGSDSTSEAFGNIMNFQKLKAEAANRRADALHRGDQPGADKAQVDYEQLLKNEIAEYKRQIALRTSSSRVDSVDSEGNRSSAVLTFAQQHGDQGRNLTAFQGALTGAYQEQDRLALDKQNVQDTTALKRTQNAQAAQEQAKQAQEKAAREMHQRMDDQLSALKQDHQMSVNEEIDYWRSAMAAIKGGSAPMLALRTEINKRLAELATENRRNLERYQNKRDTGLKPEQSMDSKEAAEEFRIQAEEQKRAGLAAVQAQAAYEESALALKESTGHISKLDAAEQLAKIHAQELKDELAVVQQDMDIWKDTPDDNPHKFKALLDDEMEKAHLASMGRLQEAQDEAAIRSNTAGGALTESLDLYVQHSKDTAGQVRGIWNGTWQDV